MYLFLIEYIIWFLEYKKVTFDQKQVRRLWVMGRLKQTRWFQICMRIIAGYQFSSHCQGAVFQYSNHVDFYTCLKNLDRLMKTDNQHIYRYIFEISVFYAIFPPLTKVWLAFDQKLSFCILRPIFCIRLKKDASSTHNTAMEKKGFTVFYGNIGIRYCLKNAHFQKKYGFTQSKKAYGG